MAIYRGPGGAGDATNDATSQAILAAASAVAAANSEAAAAASAVSASNSASSASTSATNAATSATNAAASATNAANSATSAAASATTATNAKNDAVTAKTAAELAEVNAEAAESSAQAAKDAAITAQGLAQAAETGAVAAKNAAQLSATNAATSESNAAISESDAAFSATSAASSATSAATSATNAANSASSASTSATTATTQASNAATSATAAATSASNAATSATNAANSATSASTSAFTATTQATNAANSATSASSSASAAATSATNAANSATLAAGYAASINPADLVHISGTETITGTKTFSADPVISSGTANGVAYLNGSKVLTTGSAFVFDGSKMGIGTSSPTQRLSVVGAAFVGSSFNGASIGDSTAERVRIGYKDGTPDTGLVAAQIMQSGASELHIASRDTGAGAIVFRTGTGISERMRLDSSGNLGLGVTPSAWGGAYSGKAFQFGGYGFVAGNQPNNVHVGTNTYNNGTNWIYTASSTASRYEQYLGGHYWFTAPSGTAGNAISFTQAMTLNASGNLGIGTSSPNAKLQVYAGDISLSGTQQQPYAIIANGTADNGNLLIKAGNSAGVYSLIDVTSNWNGASATGGKIAFSVTGAERMRIDSSGNLLVGKSSASYTTIGAFITAAGIVNSAGTSDFWNTYSTIAGAYRFYISNAGTLFATNTTISAISDQRYKENVQDLDVGLDAVMALKPRKFDWKEGKGKDIKNDRGFIAQEFEQVFPDLIDEWKDPAPEGEEPYKSVRQDLIPVLVKAIQELKAELDATKAEVAALKGA